MEILILRKIRYEKSPKTIDPQISDSFRGDSTLQSDRFKSYQLVIQSFTVLSSVLPVILSSYCFLLDSSSGYQFEVRWWWLVSMNMLLQALLCSVMFGFGSAICDIILIFFFKQDCERAKHKTKEEEEEESVNENSFLIRSPNLRSESLLEASVRSRAATADSYYWSSW